MGCATAITHAKPAVNFVNANQDNRTHAATKHPTVLSHQNWSMPSVVIKSVNLVNRVHYAEPPATVLCHQDWIMLFVVKGSANVVYAGIIVAKTVIVFHHYSVLV